MRKPSPSRSRTKRIFSADGTKPKFAPIVEVFWRDAAGEANWKHADDLDPEPCFTTGYLSKETKTKLVLIMSHARDGDTFMRFAIPKDWIQSIRFLGRSRWVVGRSK